MILESDQYIKDNLGYNVKLKNNILLMLGWREIDPGSEIYVNDIDDVRFIIYMQYKMVGGLLLRGYEYYYVIEDAINGIAGIHVESIQDLIEAIHVLKQKHNEIVNHD